MRDREAASRQSHKLEIMGSSPICATNYQQGLVMFGQLIKIKTLENKNELLLSLIDLKDLKIEELQKDLEMVTTKLHNSAMATY